MCGVMPAHRSFEGRWRVHMTIVSSDKLLFTVASEELRDFVVADTHLV